MFFKVKDAIPWLYNEIAQKIAIGHFIWQYHHINKKPLLKFRFYKYFLQKYLLKPIYFKNNAKPTSDPKISTIEPPYILLLLKLYFRIVGIILNSYFNFFNIVTGQIYEKVRNIQYFWKKAAFCL